MRRTRTQAFLFFSTALVVATLACNGAGPSPTSPACDQSCQDDVAVRAVRETLKQIFNGALQSQPVGAQDAHYTCTPLGGTAHVYGTATSNADVGTTSVSLTYELDHCHYIAADTDPNQNYDATITGTFTENGIIAVQPGSTTSLSIDSDSLVFSGSVYSPAISYDTDQDASTPDGGEGCAFQVSQDGNQLSGFFCGRPTGVSL